MASTRYTRFLRKELRKKSELDVVVISLRAENACLKKTLVQQNRLAERFFSFQTVWLRRCQLLTTKEEVALESEQMSKKEGKQKDVVSMRRKRTMSTYLRETKEFKNKLISKVAWKKAKNNSVLLYMDVVLKELQKRDDRMGLEENEERLEYDEQRDSYVRATLARMLWLEKQLNEANQARLQQNNEDHSNALIREDEKFSHMQQHHERLLREAEDEQKVLRENFKTIERKLIMTENVCQETEREVDKLKQQLQTENMSRTSSQVEDQCFEEEEQWMSAESGDLQYRMEEEKTRVSGFGLQKLLLNGQEKIAELERQIQIYSQDLEDEKQNCSYLKSVLKKQRKTNGRVDKPSERDQRETRDGPTWTPTGNLLNESFLECPSCRAEYPVSHHRKLMSHLEICLK